MSVVLAVATVPFVFLAPQFGLWLVVAALGLGLLGAMGVRRHNPQMRDNVPLWVLGGPAAVLILLVVEQLIG